jgi:hypothetical protein
MIDKPTIDTEKLSAAMTQLGKSLRDATATLSVMSSMGAAWSGDHERARETLRRLPADRLPDVVLAAIALSALAEEVAAEGRQP